MAALGVTDGNRKLWFCGGSLINEQYVLTAAHCLNSKDVGSVEWVRLGDTNLESTTEDDDTQEFEVIEKIPYPGFIHSSVYHDIGLIKLNRPTEINNFVKPACLPTENYVIPTKDLIATGWGLTEVISKTSDFLQKVDLELFTEEECENAYSYLINSKRLRYGIQHTSQFCAGGRSLRKDTCQGDSGGPLQIRLDDMYIIVGITSFGKDCGVINQPGVYTRVSKYVPWIKSIIKSEYSESFT